MMASLGTGALVCECGHLHADFTWHFPTGPHQVNSDLQRKVPVEEHETPVSFPPLSICEVVG